MIDIFRSQYPYVQQSACLVRIVSYIIGLVFVFSGIAKALSIQNFANEIAQYVDYYINIQTIIVYREAIAVIICVIEIAIGMLSIIDVRGLIQTIVSMLLLLLFTCLTGENYLYPINDIGINSCGCFGDIISLSPKWSFIKSLVLLAISLIKIIVLFMQNSK